MVKSFINRWNDHRRVFLGSTILLLVTVATFLSIWLRLFQRLLDKFCDWLIHGYAKSINASLAPDNQWNIDNFIYTTDGFGRNRETE